MIDNSKEYILCAAIHFDDKKIRVHQPKNITSGIVICGRRHHNCYEVAFEMGLKKFQHIQGFLTSKDRFVDRTEAFEIAWISNQIQDNSGPNTLISEDIY